MEILVFGISFRIFVWNQVFFLGDTNSTTPYWYLLHSLQIKLYSA